MPGRCICRTQVFYFGSEVGKVFSSTFDVVIGSDIGYDVSLHEPLCHSIQSFLALPSENPRLVLIAEEVRWKDIYDWFCEEFLAIPFKSMGNESVVATIRTTEIDISLIKPVFMEHFMIAFDEERSADRYCYLKFFFPNELSIVLSILVLCSQILQTAASGSEQSWSFSPTGSSVQLLTIYEVGLVL